MINEIILTKKDILPQFTNVPNSELEYSKHFSNYNVDNYNKARSIKFVDGDFEKKFKWIANN